MFVSTRWDEPGIRPAHRKSIPVRGLYSQLQDIRRFARKSIQKCAKFFLACTHMRFAPGGDCFLEEPLRTQLQRDASPMLPR